MKPTDSSERIKALMRQHTASMSAAMPAPTPATASRPPPVAVTATAILPAQPAALPENPKVSWDRITIRLTAGELAKISDVVIATQQANRTAKITTTDVLRVALRRVKDQEAIDAREIKVLRARDGRSTKAGKV
jgi:hypothetical protein